VATWQVSGQGQTGSRSDPDPGKLIQMQFSRRNFMPGGVAKRDTRVRRR
jgi:hypothetical protein